MKRVYLASPLFNPVEREFNQRLAARLSANFDVFLPQRDGNLLTTLIHEGHTIERAKSLVYSADVAAIEKCEILIAVLDGRAIDEGVAFELGYARALQKTCIGLKTDDRSLLRTGDNPMISVGCHFVYNDVAQLISGLERVVNFYVKRA